MISILLYMKFWAGLSSQFLILINLNAAEVGCNFLKKLLR